MNGWHSGCHSTSVSGPASRGLLPFIPCLILLLPTTGSSAQDRTISLSNGCAPPGQTGQIEFGLSELLGLASCDLSIAFDPNLISIQSVSKSSLTQDFLLSYATPNPGLLRVSMASADGLTSQGSGSIALITLALTQNLPTGTRITLCFREARWYNESSIRQSLLGDNSVFQAGTVCPPEDGGIVFYGGLSYGLPGSKVTSDLWISLPVGVARLEGTLMYDPQFLLPDLSQLVPALTGWSQFIQQDDGQIHFVFSGSNELSGADPIQIASWSWLISPEMETGSSTDILFGNTKTENLLGFRYSSQGQSGRVIADTPQPTVTPTPGPLLVNSWVDY